ncbi:hypothetical protein G6F22_013281 [Rhizopus arrhizus]|nr:hypothetical protein G6F22_013281 [Rhizopus arrhizus]
MRFQPQHVPQDGFRVGAQHRRRAAVRHGRRRKMQRVADQVGATGLRIGHRHAHAALQDLRVGEHVGHPVDRPARHGQRFQRAQPVRAGMLRHLRLDLRDQGFTRGQARGVGGIARVVSQLGAADGAAEPPELPVVAHGDDDVAVAGGEVLVGHDVGMRVAQAIGCVAAGQVVHGLIGQRGHLHVQQRHVDVLACSGAVAMRQRGLDAGGGVQARQDVGQRHAHLQRAGPGFAVAAAGDAHQAAHALDQEVVAGPRGVGAGLAEAGDGAACSPPTLKFSISTSHCAASAATSRWPSSVAISTATDFLLRLAPAK